MNWTYSIQRTVNQTQLSYKTSTDAIPNLNIEAYP